MLWVLKRWQSFVSTRIYLYAHLVFSHIFICTVFNKFWSNVSLLIPNKCRSSVDSNFNFFSLLSAVVFGFWSSRFANNSVVTGSQSSEKDLIGHLLADYDRRVRPVRNASTMISVSVEIHVYSLIDVVISDRGTTPISDDDFFRMNYMKWFRCCYGFHR